MPIAAGLIIQTIWNVNKEKFRFQEEIGTYGVGNGTRLHFRPDENNGLFDTNLLCAYIHTGCIRRAKDSPTS